MITSFIYVIANSIFMTLSHQQGKLPIHVYRKFIFTQEESSECIGAYCTAYSDSTLQSTKELDGRVGIEFVSNELVSSSAREATNYLSTLGDLKSIDIDFSLPQGVPDLQKYDTNGDGIYFILRRPLNESEKKSVLDFMAESILLVKNEQF